jgi:hypothetical protein
MIYIVVIENNNRRIPVFSSTVKEVAIRWIQDFNASDIGIHYPMVYSNPDASYSRYKQFHDLAILVEYNESNKVRNYLLKHRTVAECHFALGSYLFPIEEAQSVRYYNWTLKTFANALDLDYNTLRELANNDGRYIKQ